MQTIKIVRAVTDLRITLLLLLVLLIDVGLTLFWGLPVTFMLAPVAMGLFLQLIISILTAGVFNGRPWLLVFHITLAMVLLLFLISRLTYFKGQVELAVGEEFDGAWVVAEQGPWHRFTLMQTPWSNEEFKIDYHANLLRQKTYNKIHYRTGGGKIKAAVIGDGETISLAGYQIKTSNHYGFAPLFYWQSGDGLVRSLGTVHLPSLPSFGERSQSNELILPQSKIAVLVHLQLEEKVLQPGPFIFLERIPVHHLVITHAGESMVMRLGDRLTLAGGVLEYKELRTWMGYTVFADPAIPWLLAAGLLSIVSLAAHYWHKTIAAGHWDQLR